MLSFTVSVTSIKSDINPVSNILPYMYNRSHWFFLGIFTHQQRSAEVGQLHVQDYMQTATVCT